MKITNLIIRTILIINFQLIVLNCFAQTDTLTIHTIKGKQYYIHIVKKGGSLYAIHKKYNIPIKVIKQENPSVLDGLSIGEKIFIPVKKHQETITQTDGNYISHKVQKKQTLYAIAKMYKVKQKDIIAANPTIVNGLKEGMIIKIPIFKLKDNDAIATENTLNYKTHLVKKGETLYGLSKTYNVSVVDLKKVNNGLKKGLQVNETIFLPIKIQPTIKTNNDSLLAFPFKTKHIISLLNDSIEKKNIYKISLMLPFYLDENDEITQHLDAFHQKEIYPRSKFAIEFYNGFLLALDSLSSDSIKFKLYVYDTKGQDSIRTKELLLKKEFKTFDLIVGPLYKNNFKKAAEFAKQNHIPITSPVKQNNKILLGNEYVFKAIPSLVTSLNQIVTLTIDSFKTENLLALSYEKSKEKDLIPLLIKDYQERLSAINDTVFYSPIKTLKVSYNFNTILSNLSPTKNNVLYMPISDKKYITTILNYLVTTLNKKEYKNYKITIVGLEDWLNYDNIDLAYFQQLNAYIPVAQHVDYSSDKTINIVKKFEEKLEVFPSKNALLGYDLAWYYANCFIKNATVFNTNISTSIVEGISLNLDFKRTGIESGFENTSTCILKFDNYTLKRIY